MIIYDALLMGDSLVVVWMQLLVFAIVVFMVYGVYFLKFFWSLHRPSSKWFIKLWKSLYSISFLSRQMLYISCLMDSIRSVNFMTAVTNMV